MKCILKIDKVNSNFMPTSMITVCCCLSEAAARLPKQLTRFGNRRSSVTWMFLLHKLSFCAFQWVWTVLFSFVWQQN